MTATVEALIRQNATDLLAYFLHRIDNAEDAADLLSETCAVVWQKCDRIPNDEVRARMWMFGVARITLLRHYRGRRQTDALSQRLRGAVRERVENERSLSDQAETHDFVREMVRSLPERQRELIILVYWDGLTAEEAAAHLKISSSTVRTHLQRARSRLGELLDGETDDSAAALFPVAIAG
ncbi:RNA polymerase sigma factor [Lysinibacter cavernae]|uniref:RNA polymerase sigma-70 factor (ECF subfamily) n=1 Tax=Lysinibacter cavernae TaxID=1640652 RepID=A0A7X5R0H1_9MICO|nr:sigma-70 family RNA polymerase sigma factor [Lysinibacter cavernae]NIH53351.1 RNA polymerase sigma-70 factor (ECF subfamily) [Lysinibacter cavernae]